MGNYIARMSPPLYAAATLTPENSIGLLMKRALQSIVHQVDRALQSRDLTHAQWVPLYWLARGECGTLAELARGAALDPGALTRALDRLEAKGLVLRERSRTDRRVVEIELTAAGREAAACVPPVLAEVLNAHLAGFSEEQWHQLVGFLQRLVANGAAMREAQGAA